MPQKTRRRYGCLSRLLRKFRLAPHPASFVGYLLIEREGRQPIRLTALARKGRGDRKAVGEEIIFVLGEYAKAP